MAETERAIRTAVQAAQKMAQTCGSITSSPASPAARPRSYGLAGEIDAGTRVRWPSATWRACWRPARCPTIGHGREALHAHPVNFALDHRTGLGDPRGQSATRLAVDMHLLTVDADAGAEPALLHQALRSGTGRDRLVGLCRGLASLVEDEQELGAACIDMGGGATGVSIFIKKHMIFADTVRHGRRSRHLATSARACRCRWPIAERIKTMHGGVQATGMDDREMIEIGVDCGDWEKDRRQVSRDRADRHHAAARRGDPRGGARAARCGRLRASAEPADRADRRRAARSPAWMGWPRESSASSAGSAGRCGCRDCRRRQPGRPSPPPSACAMFAAHPQDEWWDFEIPAERYPVALAAAGDAMVQGQLVTAAC